MVVVLYQVVQRRWIGKTIALVTFFIWLGLTDNGFSTPFSIKPVNRWDHIYRCHKADLEQQYGFGQLCFQCDEWVTSGAGWHEHCQSHLENLETLPVQCNPLMFRQTPAAVGQCLFCLFDTKRSATERFYQFTVKRNWRDHLQEHFRHLEETYNGAQTKGESNVILCPDLRCALSFKSMVDFQCHCQDIHCVDKIKLEPARKRCRIKQPVVGARHTFRSEAKRDDWLDIECEESYLEPVANTENPLVLEQVSILDLTRSVPPTEESNVICKLFLASPSTIDSSQRSPSIASSSSSEGFSIKADINTAASSVCIDPLLLTNPNSFDKPLL